MTLGMLLAHPVLLEFAFIANNKMPAMAKFRAREQTIGEPSAELREDGSRNSCHATILACR